MERKDVIVALSYIISNILAICSLSTTSWVVNRFSGVTKIGLTKICIQFKNDSEELCESLDLQTHWAVSLVFIVIGISLSFVAVFLLMLSVWRRTSEKLARIIGFMAMVFFSVAAIVFPFGFTIQQIGGTPYKLPAFTEVGYSYFMFCGSIVILTIAVGVSCYDVIRNRPLR